MQRCDRRQVGESQAVRSLPGPPLTWTGSCRDAGLAHFGIQTSFAALWYPCGLELVELARKCFVSWGQMMELRAVVCGHQRNGRSHSWKVRQTWPGDKEVGVFDSLKKRFCLRLGSNPPNQGKVFGP